MSIKTAFALLLQIGNPEIIRHPFPECLVGFRNRKFLDQGWEESFSRRRLFLISYLPPCIGHSLKNSNTYFSFKEKERERERKRENERERERKREKERERERKRER